MPPQIRRDNSPDYSDVPVWRSRDNSPESDEGNTRQRVEPPAGGSGYISDGATTVPYASLAFFWNYGRVFRRHHLPIHRGSLHVAFSRGGDRVALVARSPPYVESETIATQFLASVERMEEVD